MKLNLDRAFAWAGCLCLWLSFSGVTSLAQGQEALELPPREDVQAQYDALADQESEEGQWLAEILEALDAQQLAEANRTAWEAEVQRAPEVEAELREQLKAIDSDPKLPDSAEVQSLSLEEIRNRLEQHEGQAEEIEGAKDVAERTIKILGEEAPGLAKARSAKEQELDQARELLIERTTKGAPETAQLAAQARVNQLLAELDANAAQSARLQPKRIQEELKRDIALKREARVENQLTFWGDLLGERQQEANAQATLTLRQQVDALIAEHPQLESFRPTFEALSELRSGSRAVLARKDKEENAREANQELLEEVRDRFEYAVKREEITGITEPLGLILRRDYEWLPKPASLRVEARRVEQQMVTAQLDKLEVDEANLGLEGTALETEDLFGANVTEEQSNAIETIKELERKALKDLSVELYGLNQEFDRHRRQLAELERESRAYRDFIERRILWVRSTAFAPLGMLRDSTSAATEVVSGLTEAATTGPWLRPTGQRTSKLLIGGLVALGLLGLRRVLIRKRAEFGGDVRSYRTDRFVLTVRVAVQTLLLALPLPLIAWTVGTALALAPGEILHACGEGLREIAPVWLVLRYARGLCAPKGLGLAHFRWSTQAVRTLERELIWFTPFAVGLGWLFLTLERQSNAAWSNSLGRCAFITVMLALALFSRRLLRAESPLWQSDSAGLLGRGRSLWYVLGQLLPVALALAAFSGFYYTALEFELRLRWSLGFGFALLLLNAMLARWLFMSRRKLAVRQAIEARAQKEREAAAGSAEAQEAARMAFDAERVDIPDVDAKTRQLFRTSLTLATVIGLYLLWASALPALRGLDNIQVWPLNVSVVENEADPGSPTRVAAEPEQAAESSETALQAPGALGALQSATTATESEPESSPALASRITLADLLLAILLGLLTLVFSKNLPALLELALLQRLPLDSGARYAISTIARYLILVVGISATTSAIGIGWQKVQWLAAALTFGLAFGLQEIFANFVSGLILLLERPIRVGDIVTVGTTEGRVTQLRMRATLIQDWDRRELLVPNKEFITSNVINWTLTDPVTRVVIRVGIAYGSDVGLAKKLLLDVATKNKNVLDDPRPKALFLGFGDNSLDFQLRVFLDDRDKWPVLVDGLHSSIDAAFRQAGIEISFPQRDLHLRSVDPELLKQLRESPSTSPEAEATAPPAAAVDSGSDPADPAQG